MGKGIIVPKSQLACTYVAAKGACGRVPCRAQWLCCRTRLGVCMPACQRPGSMQHNTVAALALACDHVGMWAMDPVMRAYMMPGTMASSCCNQGQPPIHKQARRIGCVENMARRARAHMWHGMAWDHMMRCVDSCSIRDASKHAPEASSTLARTLRHRAGQ